MLASVFCARARTSCSCLVRCDRKSRSCFANAVRGASAWDKYCAVVAESVVSLASVSVRRASVSAISSLSCCASVAMRGVSVAA